MFSRDTYDDRLAFSKCETRPVFKYRGFLVSKVCTSTRFDVSKTDERILDPRFGGRTEIGHEMALALVAGADFRCVLHDLSSLTPLKGLGAELGRKTPQNQN